MIYEKLMSDENQNQRIYVGGLDPHRGLTVPKVIQRIKAITELDILSMDDGGDQCNERTFLFVTAKLKNEKSDSTVETAFDLLKKQYHNVKWMGCRMTVELAKLHFLERLKLERQEREQRQILLQQQQQQQINLIETQSGIDKENKEQQQTIRKIPRHLRIRRCHGEEAYQVDTKPHETSSWSDLVRSVEKCRTKREKHSQEWIESHSRNSKAGKIKYSEQQQQQEEKMMKKSLQSKPFLNRSVHLRFLAEESTTEDNLTPLRTGSQLNEQTISSLEQSPPEVDPVSESESSHESSTLHEHRSDDESHRDDMGPNLLDKAFAHDGNTANDKVDENTNIRSNNEEKIDTNIASSAYVWSDDDESDDSDESDADVQKPMQKRRNFNAVNTFDEFSSALDENTSGNCNSHLMITTQDEEILEKNIDSTSVNLEEDVKSNLDILVKLFPDLSSTVPNMPKNFDDEFSEHRNKTDHSDSPLSSQNQLIENNMSKFTMQRYDPSAETSKKYVIEPSVNIESKDTDHTNVDVNSNEGTPSTEHSQNVHEKLKIITSTTEDITIDEENLNTNHANLSHTEQIYEQNKLENIFHQAKTETGPIFGFQPFLFDITNDKTAQQKSDVDTSSGTKNEGFSFSFHLPTNNSNEVEVTCKVEERKDESNNDQQKFIDVNEMTPGSSQSLDNLQDPTLPEKSFKRRRGVQVRQTEVDSYVRNFLEMNEGKQIMRDWEKMEEDEENQHNWHDERKSLTLDWTRKEKYAKKQRRSKYR